jgi:D-lactate dehydrogenase
LDVYEEETELFYEDLSDQTVRDELLATLISLPNVIVTSHQAFLTDEALSAIADITSQNIVTVLEGRPCPHAVKA